MIDLALFARHRCRIEPCIAQAVATGSRITLRAQEDGAEVFAEYHPKGVSWGVNSPSTGEALLRGSRLLNGSDAEPSAVTETRLSID